MDIQLTRDVSGFLAQIDVIASEGGLDQLIHDLNMAGKFVGIAKAKALYLREETWSNPDESFRDYAVREYSMRSENIKRYIDAWKMVLLVPEHLREYFIRKPMETLIPLGTSLANDEIGEAEIDWDRYMTVGSSEEGHAVVREMTGREAVDRIRLYINMATGDISSWLGDTYEHIGYLDVDRTDVEQVKKSIYRILNKAGIKEQGNA